MALESVELIKKILTDNWNRGNTSQRTPIVDYFAHTRINVTVDARTTQGRAHLMKMEDEVRRIVHSKRKGDGANFDRLLYKLRTDLSDRTKRLHRMTFQVEIVIFSELIA